MTDIQSDDTPEVEVSDRRDLLKRVGVASAVAAVAGLGLSRQASASTGDPLLAGSEESSSVTTLLEGGSTFRVDNGHSSGSSSLHGDQTGNNRHGVRGSATGRLGYGVYGEAEGSQGHGVYGSAANSLGAGVYGTNTDSGGIGVYGQITGTQSGTGVRGESDSGSGVSGDGSTYDFAAVGRGRVGLLTTGHDGSPTGSGSRGTIARDANGTLWYCYSSNKWQELSGANTAGAFHAITPLRAFDSRIAAIPASGIFAPSTDREISVKDGRDGVTGAVNAADAIPPGATAVAFNVTATATTAHSFLSVVPGDVTSSAVSSLNWSSAGSSIANAGTVGLSSTRTIRIITGPGGSFHTIIDITGYYL